MSELVEWLHACLDEDERVARAVKPLGVVYVMGGEAVDHEFIHARFVVAGEDGYPTRQTDREAQAHFARWDPTRVLAEVDAKRRILDLHDSDGGHECAGGSDSYGSVTVYDAPCPTVRLLALPYAGQPGYRDEWRPSD
jgi:hypothetical protein